MLALGYDLKRIVDDFQRQEQESATKVVSRPPRKPLAAPKSSSA